jgi:hypothetical protein
MTSAAAPATRTADAVRVTEHHTLPWRGIDVRIVYESHSTGTAECPYSHLEVMTDKPRRPLPMTETGYKSLFVPSGTIEQHGGPVVYVMRWLEHAAKSPEWKATERDLRQGSLF